MQHWIDEFVGREDELSRLKEAYQDAQTTTRVIGIIAESGFGKTRLVQEFYKWLCSSNESNYWPPSLQRRGQNLLINPDIDTCGLDNSKPSFLWWGLRISDPGRHNETIGGALWAGVETLKPHLHKYVIGASIFDAKNDQVSALSGAAIDLATDAVGNFLSFGLLGTGKTIVERGSELYQARKRTKELEDKLKLNPFDTSEQTERNLVETIIHDLSTVVGKENGSERPIPLVVVIDDAQWLDQDQPTAQLAQKLIDKGREKQWPMLVILTSWEREWSLSKDSASAPSTLLSPVHDDKIISLGKLPELTNLSLTQFAGLTDEQREIIERQVDGHPRFLEEILLYLGRNPKHFLDRDLSMPLTASGMEEISKRSFPQFVADRIETAPNHVRRTLALAAVHGVSFSSRLVQTAANQLAFDEAGKGLLHAEYPHGFTTFTPNKSQGEFRFRAYHSAALDDLSNHYDQDAVNNALTAAKDIIASDVSSATDADLFAIVQEEAQPLSFKVAVELIMRAVNIGDDNTTNRIATRVLPILPSEIETIDLNVAARIIYHANNDDEFTPLKQNLATILVSRSVEVLGRRKDFESVKIVSDWIDTAITISFHPPDDLLNLYKQLQRKLWFKTFTKDKRLFWGQYNLEAGMQIIDSFYSQIILSKDVTNEMFRDMLSRVDNFYRKYLLGNISKDDTVRICEKISLCYICVEPGKHHPYFEWQYEALNDNKLDTDDINIQEQLVSNIVQGHGIAASMPYHQAALERLVDRDKHARIIFSYGLKNLLLGKYSDAIDTLQEAASYLEAEYSSAGPSLLNHLAVKCCFASTALGIAYYGMGDTDRAFHTLLETVQKHEELFNEEIYFKEGMFSNQMVSTIANLAVVAAKLGEKSLAKYMIMQTKKFYQVNEFPESSLGERSLQQELLERNQARCMASIGMIYYHLGDKEKGEIHLNSSRQVFGSAERTYNYNIIESCCVPLWIAELIPLPNHELPGSMLESLGISKG